MMTKVSLLLLGLAAVAAPASANLLINGDFEASSSPTITPPGWTNIGHQEGVIAYSAFGTPAYDGQYYYDIGGFGSPLPALGAGIQQTVGTVAGEWYSLTFGYSGENASAGIITVLDVMIGAVLTQYTIVADGSGVFRKPFTTTSFNYLATGPSTTIAFTVSSSTNLGNNDPLIDRVIFEGAEAVIPEPATWAMLIAGFGMIGAVARRRRTAFTKA